MSTLATASEEEFEGPRWLRGPLEGWSSIVLLATMLLAVAAAIDDARWAGSVAGGASQTGFLAPLILVAGLWGLLGAKSRLPTLVVDVLGALLGAAAVLYAVAGVVSTSPDLLTRLRDLAASVGVFYHDLVVLGVRSSQTSVFLLVMGAAIWGVGQVTAYSVYRRHRPLGAVGLAGLALLVELCVAARDQYVFLIIFAAAALLLLVRLNLLEQQVGWVRRSIGDAGQVGGLFMRSGVGFITATMIGALALTATASSAPLAGVVDQPIVRDQLVRWGQQLNQLVGGVVGEARGPSGLFTASSTISGVWESSSQPVFRAKSSDEAGHYWLGATYDFFDGTTWKQTDRTGGEPVAPRAALLAGTRDEVSAGPGRSLVKATITATDLGAPTLLAPEDVLNVDRQAVAYTNGPGGPFAMAELSEGLPPGGSYTVESLVRPARGSPGAPTQAELAALGVTYPAWTARYIQSPYGAGSIAQQTAAQVVATLPADQRDPFHIADALQRFLYSSGGFVYDTDVRSLCQGSQVVECFLAQKHGYCEYFATTMVMLLRVEGIPARYVKGYLPGRPLSDGSWEVDRGAAHAWVQVYFPGFGWIDFDPTPGNTDNGQQPAVFDPGAPQPSASASAGAQSSPTFADDERDPRRSAGVPSGGATTGQGGSNSGPLALLVVGLVALLLVAFGWRTRMRRRAAPEADAVYRGLTRLASRLGYAPLPTQTAYEYAGALGELVPAAKDELQLVARAKVEATYAHRPFQGERLTALHAAYRRARVRLLRLVFRRQRGFRQGPRLT